MASTEQQKIRVPITKLAVGDYVEAVTKQLGEVTVVQTGIVRNHFALQSLKKKGVIEVLVDPSRSKHHNIETHSNKTKKVNRNQFIEPSIAWQKRADELLTHTLSRALSGLPIDIYSLEKLASDAYLISLQSDDTLALVVRSKMTENTLAAHLIRIAISLGQYSVKNNFTETASSNLIFAGLLCRIGYHLLSDTVQKPDDQLAPLEKAKKQKHIDLLFKLLALSGQPNEQVTKLLEQQNELLDGTGYPHQLDNDKLSSAQKVFSIAINYDGLVFGFDKARAIGSTAAFRELMERSPANFDPDILQAFIQAIGLYPAGTLVKLKSGRIALVLNNHTQLTKPRVKVFYNSEFNHHIAAKVFELADSDDVIESTVKAQNYDLEIDDLITEQGV